MILIASNQFLGADEWDTSLESERETVGASGDNIVLRFGELKTTTDGDGRLFGDDRLLVLIGLPTLRVDRRGECLEYCLITLFKVGSPDDNRVEAL